MASTVRQEVLECIKEGIGTNEEIANTTGINLSVVASCTRRLVLDGVITTPKDYKAGPGSKRHYSMNPKRDLGSDGGAPRRGVEEFKIPAPDPVLAAFFGVRVKCESS